MNHHSSPKRRGGLFRTGALVSFVAHGLLVLLYILHIFMHAFGWLVDKGSTAFNTVFQSILGLQKEERNDR